MNPNTKSALAGFLLLCWASITLAHPQFWFPAPPKPVPILQRVCYDDDYACYVNGGNQAEYYCTPVPAGSPPGENRGATHCALRVELGETCGKNEACKSNNCIDGVCSTDTATIVGRSCLIDYDCTKFQAHRAQYFCSDPDNNDATSRCQLKQDLGGSCISNLGCFSQTCVNGKCAGEMTGLYGSACDPDAPVCRTGTACQLFRDGAYRCGDEAEGGYGTPCPARGCNNLFSCQKFGATERDVCLPTGSRACTVVGLPCFSNGACCSGDCALGLIIVGTCT